MIEDGSMNDHSLPLLTEDEIRGLVDVYFNMADKPSSSTQEILDSGAIPRLKGYTVRPGKVSDSIFGGKVLYPQRGSIIEENPPLVAKDGTPLRIMVRTRRISTHDINRGEIPFKDQILAVNHYSMRRLVAPAIGTSEIEVHGLVDNSLVIAAENLQQIPLEMVVRAHMAKSTTSTSLFMHYRAGRRTFCGHPLPEGLIANGPLPYVMDTPSTKSDIHDASVSPQQLVERNACTRDQYAQIRNSALFAFGIVSQFLSEKGIILVDTKTEHGINRHGQIVSQDELYTMDSSRFWLADDYKEQLAKLERGEIRELNPKSYSKEFARGFSQGDKPYTDNQRSEIAVRYVIGMQHLLGQRFLIDSLHSRDEQVVYGLQRIVDELL
ncbi:phosphoribosylaminoimidazolesuccinocarboxamide synthase [Candidatus Woesearchaeota archaeon]|nr:phosphoribosylaminoimidazolesuccinocarboxamide synthase [Candidatus Woesearchaeota archaeon]